MTNKKLFSLLVVTATLSLIFSPVGCGKPSSPAIPPSPVESMSPSHGASSVPGDAPVIIQFKSPIWLSEFPVTPGEEPLQLHSSKVADRFRIIDATTGEMVRGTITIEGGKKLTFELPAGESWKPNNTYWIETTADASLKETYEEGAWQNLFLAAFTTQDLDADQFPVHHPIEGSLAQLLNDIAYDVDTSSSLSFDELKNWIENAPDEAKGTSVTKFHFWPNIINLTEVYYWEDNHALFNDILDQLLEREPNKAQLKSDLTAQIARGDRVFAARDFITSLIYGFKTYWEVHYGLLINLDNLDQTGIRQPYVQEILVHEYGADGLPVLHDPHTEELEAMFIDPASVPIGKAWDLCLRGNLKRTKYNAIVVDKLDQSPAAEFYIERVEPTCGCDFFSDLDTSVPDVPGKPRKPPPPPHPEPKPVWEPQPLPEPGRPKNPKAPPNPKPRPAAPPVEPWPFPADPIPLPEPATEEPGLDEGARQGERCQQPETDCSDQSAVANELLPAVKSQLETARQERRQDRRTFERFDYQFGWFVNIGEVRFNDPCLNKLLKQLTQDIAPLLQQMDDIYNEMRALWEEYKEKKESMGGDPILQALDQRDDLWSILLEFRGEGSELWRQISEGCPIFIPSGGGVVTVGKKTLGISKQPKPIVIGLDLQGRFQEEIHRHMMNGGTWDEAVDAAVNRKDIHPEGYRQEDSIIAMIWRGYADCLKRLHQNQLEIVLKQHFGDDLSPEQLEAMKNVMFNGKSALTAEQKSKYDAIQEELKELQRKIEEKASPRSELLDRLNEKRKDFRAKAWRCCFFKSRENILRLFQQQLILEAYPKWCDNPDSEEALPLIPVYPGEYLHPTEYEPGEPPTPVDDRTYCDHKANRRFCAVLCHIRDNPEFERFQGLRAYAKWLISCNCPTPCHKLVDPCDPECEECAKRVPPTTTPPTPPTPPAVTPPTEVTPPPTETLPPTTEVLRAEVHASTESFRNESGCRSTLTISYGAQDLTAGSYPVINVVLTVNGETWHDSGTISTVSYQNSVSREVGCGQTFNIQVAATNKNGQTVIVPGSITTPVP